MGESLFWNNKELIPQRTHEHILTGEDGPFEVQVVPEDEAIGGFGREELGRHFSTKKCPHVWPNLSDGQHTGPMRRQQIISGLHHGIIVILVLLKLLLGPRNKTSRMLRKWRMGRNPRGSHIYRGVTLV